MRPAARDPTVTECPTVAELEAASGGEVVSGPEVKYYVDMRSDVDELSGGMLCCYRVKHTGCGQPKLGGY
jgi:hypothetical protein